MSEPTNLTEALDAFLTAMSPNFTTTESERFATCCYLAGVLGSLHVLSLQPGPTTGLEELQQQYIALKAARRTKPPTINN